ncbi:MAG: hypothetical protein H6706_19000 [Myxococcales bacterium]|nr:hypothetical protein [Myxococcales bacterium]
MDTLFAALDLGLAVAAVVAIVRRHRAALRQHPPLPYMPGEVPWRWAEPPPGLEVHHAAGVSILTLPWRRPVGRTIAEGAAYAVVLAMVAMSISGFVHGLPWSIHLVTLLIFGPLAWVCLRMATRLWRIELRPDGVTFVERGALWWHRHRHLRRPVQAHGKMQSALTLNEGEDPEHDLLVTRRMLGVRFRSACDQSQGSWVVGGINAWNTADPKRNPGG